MMKFIIISALVAVACAGSINPGWKIVGGADAVAGQFPYIVSVRQESYHSCGGSIIDVNWILTAAHCVEGAEFDFIKVVAGSHLLSSVGTVYNVDNIIVHVDYDSWTNENDIALLKLTSSIVLGPNVATIGLPVSDIGAGENVVLCGWGTTSYPGSISNNLQFINLKTVTNAKCNTDHDGGVFDSNVCTLTAKGEGACHGDSGGPLTDSTGDLIGIVSWGRPCAAGFPDVFTRVHSFTEWIKAQMLQKLN